jgi:hypothetical protein
MSLPPAINCPGCCDCPTPTGGSLAKHGGSSGYDCDPSVAMDVAVSAMDASSGTSGGITGFSFLQSGVGFCSPPDGPGPFGILANVAEVDPDVSMLTWSVLMPGRTYIFCWQTIGSSTGSGGFIIADTVIRSGSFTFTATDYTETISYSDAGIAVPLSDVLSWLDSSLLGQEVSLRLAYTCALAGESCP